jgi:hypothetical protein
MIVTHATVRGPQGFVFLTRAEAPLRIVIHKSAHPEGPRILHGTVYPTSTLDELYRLLSPLLYGAAYPEIWETAELEALVRPLLKEGDLASTGYRGWVGVS